MRRVLNFTSPRGHYVAEAVVVWCFDHRFETAFRKLLKRVGMFTCDSVRVAGGAKSLASPDQESARAFVLDQIRTSIRLHGTRTAVLMLHSDCGAYGGLAAFNGDASKEASHHAAELQRAASFLKQQIPGLTVKGYFVDFEGIWEIESQGDADLVGAKAIGGKV